jgi:hypothetical protein
MFQVIIEFIFQINLLALKKNWFWFEENKMLKFFDKNEQWTCYLNFLNETKDLSELTLIKNKKFYFTFILFIKIINKK